ncbi:haloacid dehalogenase-like hydrolase [Sphaerimonospora mesophila]|uniref:HAD family hydrolase n=1 Tax=Sphaerimonospora mesophila TaxID=37483 RepID=UPI0009FB485A
MRETSFRADLWTVTRWSRIDPGDVADPAPSVGAVRLGRAAPCLGASRPLPLPEAAINRLVLWNIDLTLVDVTLVTRDAYADAFRMVTGRPLVKLAPAMGRPDSEIIFETLAVNGIAVEDHHLPRFLDALTVSFADKHRRLAKEGRMMPGAKDALKAVSRLDGVVQSVLTGTIKDNAMHKLAAFGLDRWIDFEIGGYGEEVYPKATLLQVAQGRAKAKYGSAFTAAETVLIGDSARDVQAARIGGAGMIAVASGRSTVAELREAGADIVLRDLSNASEVVAAVARLTTS